MTRKQRLQLIDKFRKGRLEGLELKRFEQLLEENAELRRDLMLDQELSEALDEHSDYNLFGKLMKEAEGEYFKPQAPLKRYWPRVAAIISLTLVAGSALWWFGLRSPSPSEIFNDHFEPYQAPASFRSNDLAQLDEDFMLGMIQYEDGQFEDAIVRFEKAYAQDSLNYTARFLTAVSHMALKQFNEAESIFLAMEVDPSHLFQDQCRWYLGLLYLSDEDERNDELADFYSNKITDSSLLERLKNFR